MTDQLAAFGIPGWLPPAVAHRIADESIREALESKRAEAARELRADEAHQRALAMYREEAEARGEVVTALQLATGQGLGRPVTAIFAEAMRQADQADRREAARVRREGESRPVHVDFGPPQIHGQAARSETRWKMANAYRHWRDAVEARRAAATAEAAAQRSRDDYGYVCAGRNPS